GLWPAPADVGRGGGAVRGELPGGDGGEKGRGAAGAVISKWEVGSRTKKVWRSGYHPPLKETVHGTRRSCFCDSCRGRATSAQSCCAASDQARRGGAASDA